MKCKNCGFEVNETDKFCEKCGAKVEQKTRQQGIESSAAANKPKQKMCYKCGKLINEDTVFCPYCHTMVFNKNCPLDNSVKKKVPLYKVPGFWVLVSLLSLLIIGFLLYIGIKMYPSFFNSLSAPTSAVEEEIVYKSNSFEEMTYLYNSAWSQDVYADYAVYDEKNGGRFTVCAYVFDRLVTYEDVEDVVNNAEENNKSSFLKLEEKTGIKVNSDDVKSYFFYDDYIGDDENEWYYEYYVFTQKDTLFTIMFNNSISGYDTEFDECKEHILKNIKFEKSDYVEPTTEEPTTEEPTTEPPTEKPTDITETMTLLYDDSNISVYYSDTELSSYYSDDEVDVHLFVKNKMNKSIEIQADTVVLDGISYNKVFCSDPISANSRGMIELTVEDCSNTSPSKVGADLRYFNADYSGDTVHISIISQSVK